MGALQLAVVDANLRKAVCGCIAVGCGVSAGAVALEGIRSSQQGATITLSLPLQEVPSASREACAAKVMVPTDKSLHLLASNIT